jgi:predicted ATP-grasp superfamily ATP-dependent carboligase
LSLVRIEWLTLISCRLSHQRDIEEIISEVIEGDVKIASLDSGEDVVDCGDFVNDTMKLLELFSKNFIVSRTSGESERRSEVRWARGG